MAPVYPEELQHADIGGVVRLNAVIGTAGRVREAVPIDDPAIHPALVAAAIQAVNQWEFDETLLNCVPVEVTMQVTVSFAPGQ